MLLKFVGFRFVSFHMNAVLMLSTYQHAYTANNEHNGEMKCSLSYCVGSNERRR